MSGLTGLIEEAANVLSWRGHVEYDDYVDDEIVAELVAIAGEGTCDWCPETLTPDAVADHWLARKQEEYERSLPTWTCDCGAVYKVLAEWGGAEEFYQARNDGLLGDRVGSVKKDTKGRTKHSDACPGCGERFADMITRQLDPQGSLF